MQSIAAAVFAGLCLPIFTRTDAQQLPADFKGSMRAGFASSSRHLDAEQNLFTASLWLRGDATAESLAVHVDAWQQFGARETSDATRTLREAYVTWRPAHFDLRVGKQIISWGRADKLNPTDNLSPKDLTLVTPDDDDQRLGTLAAQATLFVANYSLAAIWLPQFRPSVVPLPVPSGIPIKQMPANERGHWAVKLERSDASIDWSLSYLDGRDLSPDISASAAGEAEPTVSASNCMNWRKRPGPGFSLR